MTRVTNINPPELGPAVGFSHVSRGGGMVFLGGQIGCDETGRIQAPGDIGAQFGRAIANAATALRAAGCSPEDVIKITYFVTDLAAYRAALPTIGPAYRNVFGRHYPATSLFEVSGLFDPQAMVEIECVAVAGG